MSLEKRLAKLEARKDAAPRIRWENMHATRLEDIVPDGVIDWHGMFVPPPAVMPDIAEEGIARWRASRSGGAAPEVPPAAPT